MRFFDKDALATYLLDDTTLAGLRESERPGDDSFASHRWLLDSPPKRMLYAELYGDLLLGERRQVVDVGGGFCSLSRKLLARHDYTLVDFMTHDQGDLWERLGAEIGTTNSWQNSDWADYAPPKGATVVANDLFPNVDQRLDLFLSRYLPTAREIRLSLTYYNTPRYYRVHRVDAEEQLHIVAWTGAQLAHCLKPYEARLVSPCLERLSENPPSLFANNRQVVTVRLRGGTSD